MGRKADRSIDKSEIIQIAFEVFVEKGYVGTSLDDIAERLQTTRTPIYYYFKSKENLFCAVAKKYYNDIVFRSKKIYSKDITIFDMFYEELANITASDNNSYMLLMPDIKRMDLLSKDLFQGEADPLEELYYFKLEVVKKAINAGELKLDIDPKEFLALWYYFFYGAMSNSVQYLYDYEKELLKVHGSTYIELLRSKYQK